MTTFDEEMRGLRALATDAREAIDRLDEGLAAFETRYGQALTALATLTGAPLVPATPAARPAHGPPPMAPTPPPLPPPRAPAPLPERDPWRPERARTAEELQALAETIHADIKAHPWSSAAEIAHRLNVPVKELQIPMFLLRGMTPRRKPSGEPERIQIRGEKQAARYAVVGERTKPSR